MFSYVKRFGNFALLLVVLGLMAFIAFKIYERQKFYRHLRAVRITPDELHQKMQGGEKIAVVDLRSGLAFATDPFSIPGSIRIAPEEFEHRAPELPSDIELVLYCT